MFRAAARMNSPFDICTASITLGFPTSFNFLIRNTICPFNQYASYIALGIPSGFAFLPRKIVRPFNKYPIRTSIALTSLTLPDKIVH
jgi:hypothetical protein